MDFLTGVLLNERETLTGSQERYLYRIRTKWETRAKGEDTRWNTEGSRPGRPMKPKTKRESKSVTAKAWKRYERENKDPLLRAITERWTPPEDEFRHLLYPKKGRS